MKIIAHKTRKYQMGETLFDFIVEALPSLEENTVLAITSKIVSLAQERFVKGDPNILHQKAVEEASTYCKKVRHKCYFTESDGRLSFNAGIDTSNISGGFLLMPREPFGVALDLWKRLRHYYKINHLGVILTDSRTNPFFSGSIGRAVAWCGFQASNNLVGHLDLEGRRLQSSNQNVLEAMSAAAVMEMGESDEQCPLATMTDMRHVHFTNAPPTENEIDHAFIKPEEDIYIRAIWQYVESKK